MQASLNLPHFRHDLLEFIVLNNKWVLFCRDPHLTHVSCLLRDRVRILPRNRLLFLRIIRHYAWLISNASCLNLASQLFNDLLLEGKQIQALDLSGSFPNFSFFGGLLGLLFLRRDNYLFFFMFIM